MFIIRAAYSDTFEVRTTIEKAHAFFAEIRNFIELMPNVESIHTDAKGVTRWTVRDDIPLIGSMKQTFPVRLTESSLERIEWSPIEGEQENLLRYAADFMGKSDDITIIKISQTVEVRRNHGRELHPLAGLAGEKGVSAGMQRRVAEMIKAFVKKSKEILEK